MTAGLVLAAGSGSRLGRPKALVSYDGRLLVERALGVLLDAGCDPVVVVLGADASQVVAAASLDGASVVVNEEWATGMGSSLRRGLDALAGHDAAIVLVVDQPGVGAEHVRRLLAAAGDRPAVAASYGGEVRNPVLLDASIWAAVSGLAQGDVGARAWMRAHPDEVRAVACDDLGGSVDIDTPDDLRQALEGRT